MKTVIVKKEGVKMNSSIDFGKTSSIKNEFEYLMDTMETMWDIDIKYFYRVTDDGYIQLAYKHDDSELQIVAQYRIRFKTLKENILFIIKKIIEAYRLYNGFPLFVQSSLISKLEFNSLIEEIKAEKYFIREEAIKLETEFIQYLKEEGLNPLPTGNTAYSWEARCPNAKGKHNIMVSTKNNEWGCGYCGKKGGLNELKVWIEAIFSNSKNHQSSELL